MNEYHGDKEHFEDAFDAWLECKDVNDMVGYGNEFAEELKATLLAIS